MAELNYLEDAENLDQAVFLALGAASACWDNLAGAGVFESTRAKLIGDQLLEYIKTHNSEKWVQPTLPGMENL